MGFYSHSEERRNITEKKIQDPQLVLSLILNIETDPKKTGQDQKLTTNKKNLQFLSNELETWSKWRTPEEVLLTEFHDDRPRIVDFFY